MSRSGERDRLAETDQGLEREENQPALSVNDDDAVFDGVRHEACGVMKTQFLDDIVSVGINGADADMKHFSDFLMRMRLCNQLEDLALTRRQSTQELCARIA